MGLSIIIAIVAFLVVTLILVALLLYAKAKLTPSGEVKIDINDGEKSNVRCSKAAAISYRPR